jgi:hypothetical protein
MKKATPNRRAALQTLAALSVAGCGGGGGDTPSPSPAPVGASPAPPASPPASVSSARNPNASPATGTFGGGQGKILFVEDDDGRTVKEIDLRTRQISTLVTPVSGVSYIRGGVSRAANGRFAVLMGESFSISKPAEIGVFDASGNTVKRVAPGLQVVYHPAQSGALIAPDGNKVAYIVSGFIKLVGDARRDALVMVAVMDVGSGEVNYIEVLRAATSDASTPAIVWTPDSRQVLFLNRTSLRRIDVATSAVTKIHDLDLSELGGAHLAGDGRTLWFNQTRGNANGPTIWSMDIDKATLQRRSLATRHYGQYQPVLSPDGQWMLMQEGIAFSNGSSGFVTHYMTAMRITDPPVDTGGLANEILDSTGKRFEAYFRMAWY